MKIKQKRTVLTFPVYHLTSVVCIISYQPLPTPILNPSKSRELLIGQEGCSGRSGNFPCVRYGNKANANPTVVSDSIFSHNVCSYSAADFLLKGVSYPMSAVCNTKFTMERGGFQQKKNSQKLCTLRLQESVVLKKLNARAEAMLYMAAVRFTMHHMAYIVHFNWPSQTACNKIQHDDCFYMLVLTMAFTVAQ